MLTPTEMKVLDCICTGQAKDRQEPIWRERVPAFVINLIDQYLQLRRCLLGGAVERYVKSGDRFDLYLRDGRNVASTGFVWKYSGERPGCPVINFTFPEIEQNSADICYSDGFTLNLLYAKQGADMSINVSEGWVSWPEPRKSPTRAWAVLHRLSGDLQQSSLLIEGIRHWKERWNIA